MICGQIRWTWQSMAPAVRIRPLPAMISVDGPITRSGCTPAMMSGLPALPMRDDAAVANADVRLDDAPVVDDHRAGDHGVGGALGAGGPALAHRLAHHLAAAEDDLVAGQSRSAAAVLGDLDDQVGVGEPDPVAGGGAVQRGVAGPGQLASCAARPAFRVGSGSSRAPPAGRPAAPARTRCATPGSKRTAVPAGMSNRCPWAASRSNDSAALACGRCTWQPTCTGRSPVLTISSSIRGAPALISMSPSPRKTSPGIMVSSFDLTGSGGGR